ncbi:MAG: T9SS type A sorting domain-containing protein [Cytophagales bacterium]|nr:T9SS type A sorting domain-containing protein [Cytophagales bacterium]
MKKLQLIPLLLAAITTANAQLVFQKTFGGDSSDIASSVQQTADGGYIIAGNTNSFGAGGQDVFLIKTDFNGDTLWTKTYGGADSDIANSVQQTLDGGYIIGGNTVSFDPVADSSDIYLIKTDPMGDTLWTKAYGGTADEYCGSVQEVVDGLTGNPLGYIIAGNTNGYGAGLNDLYLVRTDTNGNMLWTKTYGGANNEYGYAVQQTGDMGFIITGYTSSFGAGGKDVLLIKTDSIGDTLWTKTYGGSIGDEEGYAVKQTGDGGYIISGYTSSFGAGNDDIYLIKTDANGDTLWTRAYGGGQSEYGYSVQLTNSGGYVVTGNSNSFGASSVDVYLLRIDSAGSMIGNMNTFGKSPGDDYFRSIKQTTDGGYIIAGYSQSFGVGGFDVFLIKADSTGSSAPGSCGGGAVPPTVGMPATVVSSTATLVGSGGTVNSTSTIINGTSTAVTELPLGLMLTIDNHVSCNGAADGVATATVSGGVPPYDYTWWPCGTDITNTTLTTVTQNNLAAGPCTILVQDAFGCFADINYTINEPDPIVLTITIDTNISCFGEADGVVTVTKSGGISPFDYVWSNGSSTLGTTDTSSTITGLADTTWSVTVTDGNGCSSIANVTLTVAPPLSLTTGVTGAACGINDGMAWVTVSGGTTPYFYLWNDLPPTLTDTVFNLYSGSYTVIVTDFAGCKDSATVVVNDTGASIIVIDSVLNISCNGDSSGAIYTTVSGGVPPYSYSWSNGDTTEDVSGLIAGSYTFTVTDTAGCISLQNINLTEPAPLVLTTTVNNNVYCNGDSNGTATATMSGGTAPFTYLWDNTETDSTAIALPPDTNCVTVTDAVGCISVGCITITEPPPVTITITSTDVLCNGAATGQATAAVTGGTPAYTYLWSPIGGTDTIASNLPAGTYTIYVTDLNGCTDSAVVIITEPAAALSLTTGSTDANCLTNNGTAWVTVTGGTAPYTYLWNDTAPQTTDTAVNLFSSNYMVTVTDSNGCKDSSFVIVNDVGAPVINNVFSTNITCNDGADGAITITVIGGTQPYAYLWSNGSVDPFISNLVAGTYTVAVTDSVGCISNQNITLTQPVAISLIFTLNNGVSCNGGNNGSATVSATGGTPPYTYFWDNLETDTTAINLPAGTHTVTITDSAGCIAIDSTTISEPLPINLNTTADSNVSCNGGTEGVATVILTGGISPYDYRWSTGDSTIATTNVTNTVTGLLAGSYSVTITDANGCPAIGGVVITEPDSIVLTTGSDSATAGNNDGKAWVIVSGGTQPYLYQWSDSAGQTSDTATGLPAGFYTVVVTDSNGCKDSASVAVSEITGIFNLLPPLAGFNLQVYPNPNTGQFTLSIDLTKKTNTLIKLYHISGKRIFAESLPNLVGLVNLSLDLSKYPKGIYYLQIVTDGGVITKKVDYQ